MNWKEFEDENKSWTTTDINTLGTTIFFCEKDNPEEIIFTIDINGYKLYDFSDTTLFEQHETINFLMEGAAEWFKGLEPKYNIILGQVEHGKVAYSKTKDGSYNLIGLVDPDDDEKYTMSNEPKDEPDDIEFTEDEINDLKSKLPVNMAKIIDLAKVEVKD